MKGKAMPLEGRWAELADEVLDTLPDPITEIDKVMVERFVRNLRSADEASAAARREPFVPGSQGQPSEHPGFLVAARCEQRAIKYARALGLLGPAREQTTGSKQSPGPPARTNVQIAEASRLVGLDDD